RLAGDEGGKLPGKKLITTPQPERLWNTVLDPVQLQTPPFLTESYLILPGSDGTVVSLDKIEGKELFRYKLQGPVHGGMARHDSIAYFGSEDFSLYAMNMANGKLLWRFIGTAPIVRKVEATDRDVYVSPERVGLYRVDRKTGAARWLNRSAVRFIAANPKFVYAADRVGSLLV